MYGKWDGNSKEEAWWAGGGGGGGAENESKDVTVYRYYKPRKKSLYSLLKFSLTGDPTTALKNGSRSGECRRPIWRVTPVLVAFYF